MDNVIEPIEKWDFHLPEYRYIKLNEFEYTVGVAIPVKTNNGLFYRFGDVLISESDTSPVPHIAEEEQNVRHTQYNNLSDKHYFRLSDAVSDLTNNFSGDDLVDHLKRKLIYGPYEFLQRRDGYFVNAIRDPRKRPELLFYFIDRIMACDVPDDLFVELEIHHINRDRLKQKFIGRIAGTDAYLNINSRIGSIDLHFNKDDKPFYIDSCNGLTYDALKLTYEGK